jgi:hypothetical protein
VNNLLSCVPVSEKMDLDSQQSFVRGKVTERPCNFCGGIFYNEYLRNRHELSCGKTYRCKYCNNLYKNHYNGKRHENVCIEFSISKKTIIEPMKDQILAMTSDERNLTEYETAFQDHLKSYFIRGSKCSDLNCFLQESKQKIIDIISRQLKEHKALKVNRW